MTLGTLERVDLRSVWTNEAYDFTPWLAGEDNLAALGRVLGLDLELEGTEQGVGPYSADIVCKDKTMACSSSICCMSKQAPPNSKSMLFKGWTLSLSPIMPAAEAKNLK